ncbi:HAD family hydrolase [Pseudomonas syringae]|uniref:HAD family hydrolase n=1 Tax=Pseudomonas syringae TaxID=317 RepID=UPI001BCEA74E|nr:hypothetical protein [Pseudomonas syringae]MBS7414499.1 HAD family hydrolase [Pseudomonas syringae]MBS7462146.1 HAD family hydrolase [Pseudomonas syringae]
MRVLLFDLDFTLANTTQCLPYLTTQVGRDGVLAALEREEIAVEAYDSRVVERFNSSFSDELCAVVLSDSPKNYCLKVLELCGYRIRQELVFGNQKKPMVDFDRLTEALADELDIEPDEMKFLVIGDSPKDIYFAHNIQAPSIFATWGTRHSLAVAQYCRPTIITHNYDELRSGVRDFIAGDLDFDTHDFYEDFDFYEPDELELVEIDDDSIGFCREYVPDYNYHRGSEDKWASQDLHWVFKPAKNYRERHHRSNQPMQMFGAGHVFPTKSLKRLAGIYKQSFLSWLRELGVRGRVLIIPVPASVPQECNLSSPISLISEWWGDWVNADLANAEVSSFDVFRRIVPKHPSHDSTGPRHQTDQLPTLGVEPGSQFEGGDVDYVIILDDVVTSGSHMNAIASIIHSTDLIPGEPEILGYALFKTVHPENDDADCDVL